MTTTKDKILQFLEYKGINKNQFYKDTGLSNGFLDKSNYPQADKLAKIINAYKDLSPEWLLTGKGSMIRSNNINNAIIAHNNNGNQSIANNANNAKIRPENNKYNENINTLIQQNKTLIDINFEQTKQISALIAKI